MSNILAQKKEIKRLEKVREKEEREAEEDRIREEDEARERAVQEFEKIQMGLEAKVGGAGKKIVGRDEGKIAVEEDVAGSKKGEKRKFELDEDELLRIAREERTKVRKAIDEEKVGMPLVIQVVTDNVVGLQDYAAIFLGTIDHPVLQHQQRPPHHHEESKAVPRMPRVSRRQTPLLFSARPNRSLLRRRK